MSGARASRRLAFASYGAGIGLAVGSVIALAVGNEFVAGAGAAIGVVTGVVLGRVRERRAP